MIILTLLIAIVPVLFISPYVLPVFVYVDDFPTRPEHNQIKLFRLEGFVDLLLSLVVLVEIVIYWCVVWNVLG